MNGNKLWGGRFAESNDQKMMDFNSSIHVDKRLAAVDIQASQAYATALFEAEILNIHEHEKLQQGLGKVKEEWLSGEFVINPATDEDIHTANERRLGDLIGKVVAGKLHTGRSRNDQVSVDTRMWLYQECTGVLVPAIVKLIQVILVRAQKEIKVLMPGYTHLQRAQPTRWSHFLLSHGWNLQGDLERLSALLLNSQSHTGLCSCPLGSGALAGNPFPIDREFLAKELDFSYITPNSMQATGDRDFILDCLYCCSTIMTHLSRFAEDLIIFSSMEFGFITISDKYSTGSSLMPQKKNPDSLELIRGKAGRIVGNLTGFLVNNKGLPSTYNKDLQEDKELIFDSLDNTAACSEIFAGVIETLSINPNRMREKLSNDMLATDVAEYLVRKRIPFREAHHAAGSAVRLAETKGCDLSQLNLQDLQGISQVFQKDICDPKWWSFERSVESRQVIGGTAESAVWKQIDTLTEQLSKYLAIKK